MVDQSHLFDGLCRWVLRTELIPEVKIVLRYLTVLEVLRDLQIAEKVRTTAVDHRDPLLIKLLLVEVGKADGADGRVDIATGVAHDDAQFVSVFCCGAEGSSAHRLGAAGEPLS